MTSRTHGPWPSTALAMPIVLAGTAVWVGTIRVQARQAVAISDDTARAVAGTIDIHVHSLPDDRARSIDALDVARLAKTRGMRGIVLKNAMNTPVLMNVAQMQEAAKLGALIEFVGGNVSGAAGAAPMDSFADAIRKIGPEFCILSSDLGQAGNPLPPDGFAQFLAALRAKGFTAVEIDRMAKQNPAHLLGLQ